MRQIKEKAPAAPASVTSANHNNQVKDTTKKLIRQAECASEVSQTYPAKATYQISEYLEYCDCVGKQPNQRLIEFMESNNEPYQYSEKVRNDWELIEEITALSPSDRDDIIELIEFLYGKTNKEISHSLGREKSAFYTEKRPSIAREPPHRKEDKKTLQKQSIISIITDLAVKINI